MISNQNPSLTSTWNALPSFMSHDVFSLPALSTQHVYARQNTTKPSCTSNPLTTQYNTPLHILAIFLILTLSTLSCSFPVLARTFPSLPIPRRFIFLSRHFGTGVLIATAFIHLLPTAFLSLTDPCLPRFWNEVYPQTAGLVAMIAVFGVVVVEQVFALRGVKHDHREVFGRIQHHTHDQNHDTRRKTGSGYLDVGPSDHADREYERVSGSARIGTGVNGRYGRVKDEEADLDTTSDVDLDELNDLDPLTHSPTTHQPTSSTTPITPEPTMDPHKQLLQCLLLEAGILFHSIFIGMALSVSSGPPFLILLLAISFHQTFEGFALGSRISALIPSLFRPTSPKPWLMCLAYGTTTPIGQVLGLVMRKVYDPGSEVGLIAVGVTNAISSGLLLFAGLVQLVAEDFLAEESYVALRGRRVDANLAVLGGGLLMAFVGAFA